MGVQVMCHTCEKVYEIPLSFTAEYRGMEHNYCSRKCYDEWQRRNKVSKDCLVCGKTFIVPPHFSEQRYCSRKCMGIAKTGTNNPFYKGGELTHCETCGKEFYIQPNRKKVNARFCSSGCYGVWRQQSGISSGENNPMYRDGSTMRTYTRLRRKEWKQIADRIRDERGNVCQVCGIDGSRKKLPVHHRVPYDIGQDDSDENLLVVCQSCHATLDNIYYSTGLVPY
jgi:5-methylcytosine-specific restriction endonuclease McrA